VKALDFVAFFRDLHGFAPLPWQTRLAHALTQDHEWPDVIDLPTASGKTACLDIALFHLAWCAQRREPWRAARRIVFVVDRRIIVDAAAERAERIRAALEQGTSETIRQVAALLKQLGGDEPLRCQKLRGGMAREPSFTPNPAQPLIITSTIDQIGSRLLFRGYGVSPYAAPIHAGMLGHDTLVLLDEAHLGESFAATVSAVTREQSRAEQPLSPLQPIRLVAMSATARAGGRRFGLNDTDLAHPIIAERRKAPKPAYLVDAKQKSPERLKALCRETLGVYDQLEAEAPAVAVIVNRIRTARTVFEELRRESSRLDFDIDLMIGRSRPLDRDAIARRVVSRTGASLASDRSALRGLIVVATQTIEVGADLDFQGMVTECAALDALTQRFGRLDRLGRLRKARAVIVGGGEDEDDPVYGAAVGETWRWLESVCTVRDERRCVDFSIEALEGLVRNANMATLTGEPPEMLELTPSFVDLLCQTAPAPTLQPDVAALLHGLGRALPDVQVVWRADLPIQRTDEGVLLDPGLAHVANELLDLNPPSSLEALSLPAHAVRAWLENSRREPALADMEGAARDDEADERASKSTPRLAWKQTPNGWHVVFPHEIKPGDTITVPAGYGGCDEFGFASELRSPVRDLSTAARKELQRTPLLIITQWNLDSIEGVDPQSLSEAWNRVREAYKATDATPEDVFQILRGSVGEMLTAQHRWLASDPLVDVIGPDRQTGVRELYGFIARSRGLEAGDLTDEDLSSSHTVPVTLEEHNAGVGERARTLAESLNLNEQHIRNLEHAGRTHDLGKADPRFQSLLRAGDRLTLEGQLLAKGLRRIRVPRIELGERHEAYSVALLETHDRLLSEVPDRDLVLFIVGTHHGRGRSLMPDRADDGTAFIVDVNGIEYSFNGVPQLGSLGSDWPTLFWRLTRRYGPWGLAYLEAVLRSADRLRSEEELMKETWS
jgi:CRISPR-associated endonuclease/helicase Cas3